MTLKDPKDRFQGQAIFDAEYLHNGCRSDTAIITMEGE